MNRSAWALIFLIACDPSRPERRFPDASVAECDALFPAARTPVWVDSDCHLQRCQAEASQTGCAIELALSGCEMDVLSATIDRAGATTFVESGVLGACTATPPRSGAVLAAECELLSKLCRLDVFPVEPELEATLAPVMIAGAEFRAATAPGGELLDTEDPIKGYLAGAAMIAGGTRLAIAHYGGRYGSLDCDELDEPESAVTIVGTEDAAIIRTATAPPCLGKLAADPRGDGFLGVFGRTAPRIGRFDRDAVLRQLVPLDRPADGVDRFGSALLALDDGRLRVLLSASRSPLSAHLLALDPERLSTVAVSARADGDLRGATLVSSRLIMSGDRFEGRVVVFDAADLTLRQPFALDGKRRVSNDGGFIGYDRLTDRVAISATGSKGVVWIAQPSGTIIGDALPFERSEVPWASRRFAGGPFLVGLTGPEPQYAASLSRLEIEQTRFVPRSVTIGRGLVSELLEDARGRAWAVLPWQGVVVRIELR